MCQLSFTRVYWATPLRAMATSSSFSRLYTGCSPASISFSMRQATSSTGTQFNRLCLVFGLFLRPFCWLISLQTYLVTVTVLVNQKLPKTVTLSKYPLTLTLFLCPEGVTLFLCPEGVGITKEVCIELK